MKKSLLIVIIFQIFISESKSQNSYLGIKTSKHAGIMGALVNPAELANMPQKVDVHLVGADGALANNVVNLTFSALGQMDSFSDRFFNNVTPDGLTLRINMDVVGPSAAYAINKKFTVGLLTRGRVQLAFNNLDILTAKALADGKLTQNTSLPYTTPTINNMSANVFGWGEIGGLFAMNLHESKEHSFSAGGTLKALLSGGYANTYLTNFKMTIDTLANGNVKMSNGSGDIGLEYSGSNDPFQDIFSNILGTPNGIGFDLGATYQYKDKTTGNYILKLGASMTDIGTMNIKMNSQNSRKFSINPSASFDPKQFQGSNIDSVIQNIKTSGVAVEVPTDSQVSINLPTAINLTADWNIWKPFYLTFHMQQSLNSSDNPRSIQSANYYSFTPRIAFKVFEAYLPINISSVQGTSYGFGFKLGPFYMGTSSLLSALFSDSNKSVDLHAGLRYGFGKRIKEAKKEAPIAAPVKTSNN